jgi:DNA-binding MarR family transcriptional regulator
MMSEERTSIQEFFEIQNELSPLFARHLENIVGTEGITAHQAMTLKMLKDQDRMCKMSDIAALQALTPAAATGMVDRLIHQGLVERKFDEQDRRVILLALTATGEKKLSAVEKRLQDTMQRFLERVSESDRAASLRMLRKLREFLKEELNVHRKK